MKKSQPPIKDTAAIEAEQELRRIELAERVARNPYEYLPIEDVGILFNFGISSMKGLLALDPPVVAKRMNPASFKAWLDRQKDIGKLT